MGQFLLVLVVAIVAAAIVFGVVTMISDSDSALGHAEPDGRAVPLPGSRPLAERDIAALRFDTTIRGYRMEQVDQALRRTAYDVGYKDELITVLEAEVEALRAGRQEEADELREARRSARPAGGPEGPADDAFVAASDESDTDLHAATGQASESGTDAPEATAQADGEEAGDDPVDEVPAAAGEAAVAGASRAGAEHGR